jgi:hypothetical protein
MPRYAGFSRQEYEAAVAKDVRCAAFYLKMQFLFDG